VIASVVYIGSIESFGAASNAFKQKTISFASFSQASRLGKRWLMLVLLNVATLTENSCCIIQLAPCRHRTGAEGGHQLTRVGKQIRLWPIIFGVLKVLNAAAIWAIHQPPFLKEFTMGADNRTEVPNPDSDTSSIVQAHRQQNSRTEAKPSPVP
jgi:hypothetical protein